MPLGELLIELREDSKLTQAEAAALLKISERQYNRWENNKAFPHLKNLILIRELYGISFDSLLDEDNRKFLDDAGCDETYLEPENPVKQGSVEE